jgi:hypothetical protein
MRKKGRYVRKGERDMKEGTDGRKEAWTGAASVQRKETSLGPQYEQKGKLRGGRTGTILCFLRVGHAMDEGNPFVVG